MDPPWGEIERLAEDVYADKVISQPLYCDRCGYNLLKLPYVYQCPECGNEYHARGMNRTGVFTPGEVSFPFGSLAWMLLALLCALLLGALSIRLVAPPPPPASPPGTLIPFDANAVGAGAGGAIPATRKLEIAPIPFSLAIVFVIFVVIFGWSAHRQFRRWLHVCNLSRRPELRER